MKNVRKIIFSILFLIFAAGHAFTEGTDIPEPNQKLEKIIQGYAGYDVLVERGFDIHSLDYVKSGKEIAEILRPYFIVDGQPLDNHFWIKTDKGEYYSFNGKHYNMKFEDEYGTKDELLEKGYIENETMFFYPANGEKDWRVGHFELGFYGGKDFSDYDHKYYETKKSIVYRIKKMEHGKWIPVVSKARKKENIIIDLRNNRGGYDSVVSDFVKKLGKYKGNIILLENKGSGSCGEAIYFFLKQMPVYNNSISYKETNYNVYVIGENTYGVLTYTSDNLTSQCDFRIPELGIESTSIPNIKNFGKNKDIRTDYDYGKTFKEGVGIMPDAWAMTEEDYIKTIQWYTGDTEIDHLINE